MHGSTNLQTQPSLPLDSGVVDEIFLREYQYQVISDFFESLDNDFTRIILQAVCGSGKTIMAAAIIDWAVAQDWPVLFLAHRRELVHQCSNKLDLIGIEHGIIMSGESASLVADVQVASVQTLLARMRRGVLGLPPAKLIIFDECHHNLARTHHDLIKKYEGAIILGLTATPCRADGRGLGAIYQNMIHAPSIPNLTKAGYLVSVEYYAPSKPDLAGLKIRAGDYVEEGLSTRMDRPQLVGDIVENWGRICPDRQTIVFATGVRHSIHIRDRFRDAGIVAEHIDGSTPKNERDEILRRLAGGDVQVVTNCMVLTEGWDCPPVSCCVLARPTKSLGLYVQMAGRVLRPFEGKADAIILDHAGAVFEHGPVDSEIEWSLDPGGKIQDRQAAAGKKSAPIVCDECFHVYTKQLPCPKCGHVPVRKGRSFEVIDGQLGKVQAGETTIKKYTQEEKERIFRELKWIQERRGYKPGWVSSKYKSRFDVWPRVVNGDPVEPSIETRAWIRKESVSYAKAQRQSYR